MAQDWIGNYAGRALVQKSGSVGGSRNVFVKLQGFHNELVFPTFGGQIMNPFKGTAKLYAGDLAEYRTDENGVNPKYYILKTFEVVSASGTTVNVVRDGYHHIPFVGDTLMIAPDTIGGAGVGVTVTAVTKTKASNKDVWALTVSSALTGANAGDILVEAVANPATTGSTDTHKMLVGNINSVCPCDYDFRFADVADPEASDPDFEAARYNVSLALGGVMYINKMSPMPACVKALNTAKVNGWFAVSALPSTL